MDACVLTDWDGSLSHKSVAEPEIGPMDVRVDVRACGVTRTIENAIQGGLTNDPALTPRIPGHEFAGVVEAVGKRVSDFEPGDRVMSYFYLICGHCDACRRGDTNQCINFEGWYGVHCDGAYAEKAVLPETNVLPLPEGVSFAAGAIATDGLATPLHVCRRATVTDADTVLVIGAAGRIGVHLAQAAARNGASVLAADIQEDRLAHVDAVTGNAVTPIDVSSGDAVEKIREATPFADGPTVIVDTVGDISMLETAWESMAMGGRLVTLTTHHNQSLTPLLKEFVVQEASVIGSRYATKDEVVRAARLFADGRIDPVVTERIDLEDVPDAHERIRSGDAYGMIVLEP